jgi:hypothetical protein
LQFICLANFLAKRKSLWLENSDGNCQKTSLSSGELGHLLGPVLSGRSDGSALHQVYANALNLMPNGQVNFPGKQQIVEACFNFQLLAEFKPW